MQKQKWNLLSLRFDKDDLKLSLFIGFYIFIQCLNLLMKLGFNNPSWWGFASKAFLAILLVLAVFVFIKRGLAVAVCSETILILICLISFLVGEDISTNFASIAFNLTFVFLPMGLCVFYLKDKKNLLLTLRFMSYLCHASIYLLFFLVYLKFSNGYDYDMGVGYVASFNLLLMLDWFIESKKMHRLLFAVLDVVVIVAIGSRGPLIIIFTFVVLKLVFSNLKLSVRLPLLITIALITISFAVFYKDILEVAYSFASKIGINSRSLNMLMNDALNDTGRAEIYREVILKIEQKPFFGWGLCCGRINNVYAHNVFLELILSFGLVFGLPLSAFLIVAFSRGLINKNPIEKSLSIILVSECIVLLFSDSFAEHPLLFVTIFLCLNNKFIFANTKSQSSLIKNVF